jgi:hypothetical protein
MTTKSKGILPPRQWWLPDEEQYLREHYADTLTADIAEFLGRRLSTVRRKANEMGLHKSRDLISELARLRTLSPNHGSKSSRFKPGLVPWNKGTHYKAGGRSAETCFQPGNRPHTWVPVGSYRVIDGTLERKVNDLPGANTVRWKPVHRLVWCEANGEVPDGHLVVFKSGRKTIDPERITLDAVELITREENLRRNSFHRFGPEVVKAVQLRGVLTRAIKRKRRELDERPTE